MKSNEILRQRSRSKAYSRRCQLPSCNRLFETNRSDKLFCSNECRNAYHYARYRDKLHKAGVNVKPRAAQPKRERKGRWVFIPDIKDERMAELWLRKYLAQSIRGRKKRKVPISNNLDISAEELGL